jgi:pilus assembly protein CpaB
MAEIDQQGTKNKTWKLFGAAVIFALLAGVGTIIFLKLLEHRLEERLTPAQEQMVQVVVASGDLPVGSKVDSSTMSVRKIPSEYVNSDVITPDLFDSIDGAVLIKPLGHGKMLSQEYINLNIPKDFSDTIQIGHRAITIQVDEINSISGLVRPGNFIDLYARMQGSSIPALDSSDSGEVVIPVLEDVFVLATDRHSARPNEDEFINMNPADHRRTYDTLTLEVTPKEAALISLAESRGSLIASLRNTKDTAGVLFRKIGLGDLVAHSDDLLQQAVGKQHSRSLDGVHVDKDGHLVTKDGIVITDPNIHLNKNGLLVNKDGTVLSGRDLFVGEDGRLRTSDGKLVDTESLVAGKGGSLTDKNGTVLGSNGYQTVKGGFLVDKDGHVITNNGEVLSGVSVGSDGRVRTSDGRVITADQLTFDKDGKVRIKSDTAAAMTVDADGNVRTADGKIVEAKDLVTVGPDGVVRTKDGKVLTGVTVGKDGELYSSTGKKLSAADVMMAAGGFTSGTDGTIVDRNGKVYTAKDLVDVGEDGKIRDKNGRVIEGAYVDKDGNMRNKDGSLLTAQDVIKQSTVAGMSSGQGAILAGVTGNYNPRLAETIGVDAPVQLSSYVPYEVEYIVGGGGGDGAAKTFRIQVEDDKKAGKKDK